MLARPGQVQSLLTFTKFAPARPDKAIKWVGAQIWEGPPRSENLLVADCLDEDWAKSLSSAYNDTQALNVKIASANEVIRNLLGAIAESASECKASDPQVSEALSAIVTNFRAQAKKAGLSPV